MTENIKVSTQEYVFTHKSETEALSILSSVLCRMFLVMVVVVTM